MTQITLSTLIGEYGIDRVKNGIRCTIDTVKRKKKIENAGGFFIKAVEQGWKSGDQVKVDNQEQTRYRKSLEQEEQERQKKTETILKNQVKAYETRKSNLANARFEALEEEKKMNLKEEFIAGLQHDVLFSKTYHSKGFENPIVQAYWMKFLIPTLLSSEENSFDVFRQLNNELGIA